MTVKNSQTNPPRFRLKQTESVRYRHQNGRYYVSAFLTQARKMNQPEDFTPSLAKNPALEKRHLTRFSTGFCPYHSFDPYIVSSLPKIDGRG